MRVSFFVLVFTLFQFSSSAADAPKELSLTQEARPTAWLMAIERLRILPRPGDIQNAGILVNIADVITTSPEQKTAIAGAINEYEAAILKKAEQWEADLKTLRAEYESKVIAALPEAKRETAKKALEYSHAQWIPPMEFETKLKSDFLQKRLALESKTLKAEEVDALKKEFVAFIKTQRLKSDEKNAATIKALKEMFAADEVERLNAHDKNREVPVPEKKK